MAIAQSRYGGSSPNQAKPETYQRWNLKNPDSRGIYRTHLFHLLARMEREGERKRGRLLSASRERVNRLAVLGPNHLATINSLLRPFQTWLAQLPHRPTYNTIHRPANDRRTWARRLNLLPVHWGMSRITTMVRSAPRRNRNLKHRFLSTCNKSQWTANRSASPVYVNCSFLVAQCMLQRLETSHPFTLHLSPPPDPSTTYYSHHPRYVLCPSDRLLINSDYRLERSSIKSDS